ncbi:hypothetical protein A2797_01175 [candidate division WWE3 bacterium RIFCSPHIGHO2_01_FULL_48_15]|uniref:Zinc finger DksA/TraR C4-type domain-containing protein n=1 Tax=candidate division WWE3 bacterium RIFCSPHIGHO2_01_FULL_48_15 TaxID=1802619 RepID=A0A1F4VEI6_UNCKA|nr:MAG: hypothetical protein A2797_01175 [candidate division WWE3 bacterium RIFCSPHIGHO2_01_FULL_48_15]
MKAYLSKQFIEGIKKTLVAEEERLVKEQEELTKQDPYLNPERSSARTAEFVEEASEDLGHERVEVEKGLLGKLLIDTRHALSKIKSGKYGICENCGQWIDRARLEAFPQARYCLDCEKKLAPETS